LRRTWNERRAGRDGGDPASWTPAALMVAPPRLTAPDASTRSQPAGRLRVVNGNHEVLNLPLLDAALYTIGSGTNCDVHLAGVSGELDACLAEEHARLTVRRGRVLFHHVAAGTVSLVNGEPTLWAVLESGDSLTIGPYHCQFTRSGRTAPEEAGAAAG